MQLIMEFDGLTLSHAACIYLIYILSLSREGQNGQQRAFGNRN